MPLTTIINYSPKCAAIREYTPADAPTKNISGWIHEAPTEPSRTPDMYNPATLNDPIQPGWDISKGIPKTIGKFKWIQISLQNGIDMFDILLIVKDVQVWIINCFYFTMINGIYLK